MFQSDVEKGGDSRSLKEKLQTHYKGGPSQNNFNKYFFRVLFQVQACTQIVMTLNYLTPFLFSDFDPMFRYYLKVFFMYLFLMGQANWLCAICYSNALPDYRDRPEPEGTWYEKPEDCFDYICKTQAPYKDKNGLEWKYCKQCSRYKPPRSHHCKVCDTCILRRDHHCFLIGSCVGHYNQRYFIAFLFYGSAVMVLGLVLNIRYMSFQPEAEAWYDYVFPVSVWRLVFGSSAMTWHFCLITMNVFLMSIFGPMCAIYITGQMMLVTSGYTLYEVAKKVEVKVTTSYSENLRLVFGDYWLTSFIFPSQILFMQRNDGTTFEGVVFNQGFGIDPNRRKKLNVE